MNEAQFRRAEQRFWGHYAATPTERWLDLERPAVRVRIQELGDGPPVLFLHGGPGAGSIFAPLAAHLTGVHCILLDRPGCALSEPIDYTGRRIDDTMVDIARSVLNALGLDRVPIVASSFGSACAMWLALRHPERVAGIAHVGCPALVSHMKISMLHRLLATPAVGYVLARLPMSRSGVKQFLGAMGQNPDRVPQAFYDWWISIARDTNTLRNERELVRHGLTWRGVRPGYLLSDETVQGLPHPMYFYWGENDPFGTTAFATDLVRGAKDSRIDFVAESGHLPWFDDPRDAARRVGAFLAGGPLRSRRESSGGSS